jgi:tail tube protein
MAIGPSAGVVFVKINGLQYQLAGDWEIQPNVTENEWVANQDLSQSLIQKGVTPYMSGKIRDSGGLSVQQLQAIVGVTLTAELNNGKVYTLQQAATWGEVKLDTMKGEIAAKFGGVTCAEQLS